MYKSLCNRNLYIPVITYKYTDLICLPRPMYLIADKPNLVFGDRVDSVSEDQEFYMDGNIYFITHGEIYCGYEVSEEYTILGNYIVNINRPVLQCGDLITYDFRIRGKYYPYKGDIYQISRRGNFYYGKVISSPYADTMLNAYREIEDIEKKIEEKKDITVDTYCL